MNAAHTPNSFFGSLVFRFGVYAVITFAVFESIYAATRAYGPKTVSVENGPIEMTQVVLALLAALSFLVAALWSPRGWTILLACGGLAAYAAARELDTYAETYLFDDAYKWLVGLPVVLVIGGLFCMRPRQVCSDLKWFLPLPAGTIFGIAAIFLCFVCQIFDHPEMWSDGGRAVKPTKALVEETCELFAYMLIAFSSIESIILARRHAAVRASEPIPQKDTDALPAGAV